MRGLESGMMAVALMKARALVEAFTSVVTWLRSHKISLHGTTLFGVQTQGDFEINKVFTTRRVSIDLVQILI